MYGGNKINCNHLWTLDCPVYFGDVSFFDQKNNELLFPAKCFFCKEKHQFNEREWLKVIIDEMINEKQELLRRLECYDQQNNSQIPMKEHYY